MKGLIKGDARSLDYGSIGYRVWVKYIQFGAGKSAGRMQDSLLNP